MSYTLGLGLRFGLGFGSGAASASASAASFIFVILFIAHGSILGCTGTGTGTDNQVAGTVAGAAGWGSLATEIPPWPYNTGNSRSGQIFRTGQANSDPYTYGDHSSSYTPGGYAGGGGGGGSGSYGAGYNQGYNGGGAGGYGSYGGGAGGAGGYGGGYAGTYGYTGGAGQPGYYRPCTPGFHLNEYNQCVSNGGVSKSAKWLLLFCAAAMATLKQAL